tara:strand:- start:146 stop:1120 length:975 start_codon:yes stop_codon:yes gene_type:complete
MIKKKLIFGTQCLGSYLNEEESLSLLDQVYDFGVKRFDCAERYPFPEKNETFGLTEEIIGYWQKKNKVRRFILIDTKVTGRNFGEIKSVGGNRLLPKRIILAAEKSLKRLKTDYIDTFYIHWPDRFTNNFDRLYYSPTNDPKVIPLEAQFEAILKLKKSGKIRNFGISNESAWGLSKFQNLCRKNKINLYSQEEYSLINRKVEIAMKEIFIRDNIKFNAYSPLGGGLLTGKYFKNKKYGGRFNSIKNFKKKRGYLDKLDRSKKIFKYCKKNSISIAKLSFSFLFYQKFVNGIIFGLSSKEQFNEIKTILKKPIDKKFIREIIDI